jgi:hypothetical protein
MEYGARCKHNALEWACLVCEAETNYEYVYTEMRVIEQELVKTLIHVRNALEGRV